MPPRWRELAITAAYDRSGEADCNGRYECFPPRGPEPVFSGSRNGSDEPRSFSVLASASICVSGGGGGIRPEARNSKAQPNWLPPADPRFFFAPPIIRRARRTTTKNRIPRKTGTLLIRCHYSRLRLLGGISATPMQSVVLVRKRAERFDIECVVHANGCRYGLLVRRQRKRKQDLGPVGFSWAVLTRVDALRRLDETAVRL